MQPNMAAPKPHSRTLYFVVYAALLLLLVATVGFAFVDVGRTPNNAIAIGIACIKALLIVLFFMHVRLEPWLTWFFAGAGFLWLGIMLTLTASDYLTRNHPPGTNPKAEPVYLDPHPNPEPKLLDLKR